MVENPPSSAGDMGLIPGRGPRLPQGSSARALQLRRSPGATGESHTQPRSLPASVRPGQPGEQVSEVTMKVKDTNPVNSVIFPKTCSLKAWLALLVNMPEFGALSLLWKKGWRWFFLLSV